MRDTFSIAAYLPTIWSITEFGVTMEMTRRSYGITVAALKLDNNLKLTKKYHLAKYQKRHEIKHNFSAIFIWSSILVLPVISKRIELQERGWWH